MAALYNDNEEIKIIQKLITSENTSDYNLLIDLENIRKYSYINFKNVLHDYIKLRPNKTIEAIRLINLKKKKIESLELRIGRNNVDLNVVGIAFNPSRFNLNKTDKLISLECFKIEQLVDVKKITKNPNGFLSFIKVLEKISSTNTTNLFYWLFNNKTDIPKLNKYID